MHRSGNAPIALFVFQRPEHTRRTLESLAQNPEFATSPLFIYCDGARNEADLVLVEETRKVVSKWDHPDKTIIERDRNWGLANSIIDGVTRQCDAHGRVIVLEDDLVTSPNFLRYMNDALNMYENDDRVISINGYGFPIDGLPETFFLKMTCCWGWATWKRGWDLFESNGNQLLSDLEKKKMLDRFDLHGAFHYKKMLKDQIRGANDSWAVRWYATALLQDKLTLHPGRSLVLNIGFDGGGTHSGTYDRYDTGISKVPVQVGGVDVKENAKAFSDVQAFFKRTRPNILLRLINKGKRVITKVMHQARWPL